MTTMKHLEQQLAQINQSHDEKISRLHALKRQLESVPPMAATLLSYAEHGGEIDIVALAAKASATRTAMQVIEEAMELLERQHGNAMRENQLARQAVNAKVSELERCRARIGDASTPKWRVHDLLRAAAAIGDQALTEEIAKLRKHGMGAIADDWMATRQAA